jgi:hypothetical protein
VYTFFRLCHLQTLKNIKKHVQIVSLVIGSVFDPWLGSALALTGMVILLAECDQKPIFSWHGVSLNTIISILSTASKAWLLLTVDAAISQWKWILFSHDRRILNDFGVIDSASRGPLGSLKLLWKLRGL